MRTGKRPLAFILALLCFGQPIGTQGQDHVETAKSTLATVPADQRVDINHASLDELLRLPGLTPSWAGRILRFRPYRTKQDLLDKGIVNSQVYDRIRQSIIAHRDKH